MTDRSPERGWTTLRDMLRYATPGPESDDQIEELLQALRDELGLDPLAGDGVTQVGPEATAALLSALHIAKSESTRRDVAFAIARSAPVGDALVIDALSTAYRAARSDASLGPELLRALAVLSARDPMAHGDLLAAVVRVTDEDSRYLIIRAAKIIGRLEASGVVTHARSRLEEWATAADSAIQAEARQQLALITLLEAVSQPDMERMRERLHDSQAAFARAELSEELRHDAQRFRTLVELLLAYLPSGVAVADDFARVRHHAVALKALVDDPAIRPWPGYALEEDAVIEYRLYRVAVGFLRLTAEMDAMAAWTNFDSALVELAAAWEVMWSRDTSYEGRPISGADGLSRLENSVVLPRLGSVLERAIGRQRLVKVLETVGRAQGARHPITTTLRTFYAAACNAESGSPDVATLALDVESFARLAAQSPAIAAQLAALIPGADVALHTAGLDVTPDGTALRAYRVPTDHPTCYGNDPSVDDAVRPVLESAWTRLAPRFSLAKWSRFRDVIVFLAQVARDIRNDLPDFARSADDGGKGQSASEGDLQAYVFSALRQQYGRGAVWEASKIAGGRTDSGVHFDECDIPIEVKAEYRDVSREHVRNAYLAQVDRYAAERDRMAFLLILDLRAEHASGHRKKRGTEGAQPLSVYSLAAGFWVDGLSVDTQVTGAQPNAVVVGLFPGNQPKPSSTTNYSARPRRPSRRRRTS